MQWVEFGVLISLLLVGLVSAQSISCKDEHGRNVDWFYAYKLPKQYNSTEEPRGLDFLFLTPGSGTRDWQRSPVNVNSVDSLIGRTMTQAYTKLSHPNRVVAAYNDHPPFKSSDSSNGHTKGVLVADDKHGFWMVHSVPQFPNITENPADYFYPSTGRVYGQSFLCISIKSTEVDKIGLQLVFNEAVIYSFKISENLISKYPNLVRASNRERITSAPFKNLADIHSVNGVQFQSFSKGRHFGQELYEDWVAPVLQSDLYVQAWRRGVGMMPSNCTRTHNVWNIAQINVEELDFIFKTTMDHSKWAVSASTNRVPWICVGDVNRANRQQSRGGGTVCQCSSTIRFAYRSLIKSIDSCML